MNEKRASCGAQNSFAARLRSGVIDITGGAPELNPHLGYMLESFAPLAPRIILRSNLTAIAEGLRETGYLTNETVFSLTECPERLAVIGGVPIGSELSSLSPAGI